MIKTKPIIIKAGFRIVGENILLPLFFDLRKNPHILIVGSSGSGKSYETKYLFSSLIKYQDCLELYCMDYKCSGDYDFMDEDHLSVGADCVVMLERVYQRYLEIKAKNLPNVVLVCFDEYAAFISMLQGYDKEACKRLMKQVSEMLMMGRRLNSNGGGCYFLTVLQRPDAEFLGTARDNYFVKIVMGNVHRSIRTMLEIDEEDIPKEHIALPGHGIMMIDNEVNAFIVPTYDANLMDAMLKAKRSEAVSRAEDGIILDMPS